MWCASREAEPEGSGAMFAALTAFAGVHSQAQILSLLQSIMGSLFGADGAMLLTRGPTACPTDEETGMEGAACPAVRVSHPELEDRLQRGSIFASYAPPADLPGISLPDGARSAVLVPCSSVAATQAICAYWTDERPPFTHAELDRLRALATVAGLAFERQIAEAQSRLLRANIENRVRNVLAVLRSVGTRSAEHAPSIEDFLLHFEGRLDAIGRSQIAATRGDTSFELLLREELLAQSIQDGEDVSLEGMDVPISPGQAEALGLAMHELAVNAVKFGPFGGPGGSLTVRWWVEGDAGALALNIDWREKCAQPVAERAACKDRFRSHLSRARAAVPTERRNDAGVRGHGAELPDQGAAAPSSDPAAEQNLGRARGAAVSGPRTARSSASRNGWERPSGIGQMSQSTPFLLRLRRYCEIDDDDAGLVEHMLRNVVQAPSDHRVLAEGDRPQSMHVILDGLACRYKLLPDGRRQILAFLVPGDPCDYDAFLLPEIDHSLVTLTPSLIASISRQDLELVRTERPRLALALRMAMLQDQAVLREWLVNVGRRNAYERMAHLLWELYVRHAMVGKVAQQGFRLPLTQSDLADALGLSTVYVNKTITRLRGSGIIQTDRRQIRILLPDELRTIAGFDGSYLHQRSA